MKIGFVIYGSLETLSGGYLYDRKLVEYLRAQGDSVEIISLSWRNYAAHLTDNFSFRLPSDSDILIQDELNHPSLIAANLGKHRYPIVSLVHHLRSSELRPRWQNNFYRSVEKKYLQGVDGFIFNSQTTQGVVSDLIGNSKPSIVAYPPTDRFGGPLTEEEIKQRAAQGPLKILFLGNLIERKGLHTLLEAVKGQRSNVEINVVGSLTSDPVYARAMQSKAVSLQSPVTFHGPLDNAPLQKILEQSHLLIVPSSYEGFGIVYLEGMGFGLPAVGTDAGAAREIISHDENGFLIRPGDSAALSAHITALANDRALLARLSLNALRRYRAQPTWHTTAASIRAFLQRLVA